MATQGVSTPSIHEDMIHVSMDGENSSGGGGGDGGGGGGGGAEAEEISARPFSDTSRDARTGYETMRYDPRSLSEESESEDEEDDEMDVIHDSSVSAGATPMSMSSNSEEREEMRDSEEREETKDRDQGS